MVYTEASESRHAEEPLAGWKLAGDRVNSLVATSAQYARGVPVRELGPDR